MGFGAIAFLNPWLLAGLAALPVLWWLLRAIPPTPRLELFAGIRLLLGLEDPERQAAKTPWWLLLLRALAVAAIILGFAAPVMNPSDRIVTGRDGPVVILLDGGWASAPDWEARRAAAVAAIDEATQAGRPVAVWLAAENEGSGLAGGAAAKAFVEGAEPAPWSPDHEAVLARLDDGTLPAGQTIWFTDGLAHGAATAALTDRLADAGPLRIIGPAELARGLTPPRLDDGKLAADIVRADRGAQTARVLAFAMAEQGGERRIGVADAMFAPGATTATAIFDMPSDLIGRISRLALASGASPGGAVLADASIRRVRAGLVDPAAGTTVSPLTSAEHYLRKALAPYADVLAAPLDRVMEADPAAIFLADQGDFTEGQREALLDWVEAGGLLVRFAGPRLAAAIGEAGFGADAAPQDPLLPVALRRGGRVLGGALSWGAPKTLGAFDPDGPFRGLVPPDEVSVRTQVLAEPSPDLAGKVWATLDDGTPLVTAAKRGDGRVVLFHVSADAEWSSLPISGLFVEMLGQLTTLAPGRIASVPDAEDLAGTLWRPSMLLDRDGVPVPASDMAEPLPGESLASGRAGRDLAPGLYARADAAEREAGAPETLVLNLFAQGDTLEPRLAPPLGTVTETLGGAETLRLGPWLLGAALVLLAIDTVATLWLTGRLLPSRGMATVAFALFALAPLAAPAQTSDRAAVEATAETTLGYVRTGNARIDEISEAAMRGLGQTLARRTAVEPGPPLGVNPETDDLSLLPVVYWPLLPANLPSDAAIERLAAYLRGGGMLIIDTQSGQAGMTAIAGPEMRRIARGLNLPPLAPVDGDHVLTRSFYLLDRFPGRFRGGRVWAEAPPPEAQSRAAEEGLPQFDRVDDNVSPVIVGSADWAAAWAVDEDGYAMFPIGRVGDRQREIALRFGINVVMYALTGNYKSDQVHAPAVLERLGQ